MNKENTQVDNILIAGLTVRTNNQLEMNPETSKIGGLVYQYMTSNTADSLQHRTQPGKTFAVYTDYASDASGDYTYVIGEAVSSAEGQDASITTTQIPSGQYEKFTTAQGPIPEVVGNAWQQIWQMNAADLGGQRRFDADFEVYDQRAANPAQAIIDIYIGVESA